MKLFLTDQTKHLSKHLEDLKSVKIMNYTKADLFEKTSSVTIHHSDDFPALNLDFFFNYNIFPTRILSSKTQWQIEGRAMRIGDTIAQQVFLPPLKVFSQKLIFGVRICEIIETTTKRGFSYETLEGHVEKGISTFTIEQKQKSTEFVIHTFSKPGNLLSTLAGPLFSKPYQAYCTNAALSNVKQQLEKQILNA